MGVFYDHILSDFCPDLHRFLERHGMIRTVAKILAYTVVLVLVAVGYASYQALGRAGWIPHDHDTPVWIQGNWLVGEYRKCDMPARTTRLFCGEDAVAGKSIVGFTDSVSDDDAASAFEAAMTRNPQTNWTLLEKYFHVLPVRYFGRLERPERDTERDILSWRCQRNSDSLTCKALN